MKEGSKKKRNASESKLLSKKKNFLLLEFVRFFFTELEKETELELKKAAKK